MPLSLRATETVLHMTSPETGPEFRVKLVETNDELSAAQALRYEVFVR